MRSIPRLSLSALTLSVAALGLVACSGGYSAMFKGNGASTHPPIAAKNVRVADSPEAVSEEFAELGTIRAKAPTAQEAVDMGKGKCGEHGGNLVILNTPPFQSDNSWRVDGRCVRTKSAKSSGRKGGRPPK